MKTVLKRAEEVTEELSLLNLKNLKLLTLKIANSFPSNGSYRIKGYLNSDMFIELFEFLLSGKILKYSYTLVQNKKSLLRYDNAPHHKEIKTFPHHKHLEDKIQSSKTPYLKEFIRDVLDLI